MKRTDILMPHPYDHIPPPARNQAIDKRASARQMGSDMRHGYKEGEKAMREVMLPLYLELKEQVERLRNINEQLMRNN